MRAYELRITSGPAISWRVIECWGAGVCLFLQTGALFPLLLADPDGALSDSAKSMLRLLCLPVYAFTLVMLKRNFQEFLIALKRNLQEVERAEVESVVRADERTEVRRRRRSG